MLNQRVKAILDCIIDVAFDDEAEANRKEYKNYVIYISTRELSSRGGDYSPKEKLIRVFNPSAGSMEKTCLHELSHHIDYVKNGSSGHRKPFYEIYAKLIWASIDLNVLNPEDFDDDTYSDRNKVREIINRYVPKVVQNNLPDIMVISVKNGYSVREELKGNGYQWNALEQLWEKDSLEDLRSEREFLEQLGIKETEEYAAPLKDPCYYIRSGGLHLEPLVYITAYGKTYEYKQVLKDHGFFYSKDKGWLKKIKPCDREKEMQELTVDNRFNGFKEIEIGLYKRK